LVGCNPLKTAHLDGAQVGAGEYPFVKFTASSANFEILGVSHGLGSSKLFISVSCQPKSSA